MTGRTIIVGDVHGCFDELMDLMDKCQTTDADHVISLGDVVDRGPGVRQAVDFFMSRDRLEARSQILANHEERQLKYYAEWQRKGAPTNPAIAAGALSWKADYHKDTFLALEPKHFEWFKTLPKFMRLPQFTAPDGLPVTLVHAGCLSEVPLEDQTDLILMHVSDIMPPEQGHTLEGLKHGYWKSEVQTWWTSKAPPGAKFWASIYDGSLGHVVFGHSGFVGIGKFPHATGLDTGCCFGRDLSALVLPEWRIVSVPARAEYKSRRGKSKLFEVYPGTFVFS